MRSALATPGVDGNQRPIISQGQPQDEFGAYLPEVHDVAAQALAFHTAETPQASWFSHAPDYGFNETTQKHICKIGLTSLQWFMGRTPFLVAVFELSVLI